MQPWCFIIKMTTAILGRAVQCIKIRLLAPDKMVLIICLLTEPHTCISRRLAAPLTEEGSAPHSVSWQNSDQNPQWVPGFVLLFQATASQVKCVLLPRLTLAVWELKLQEAMNWGQNLHMPPNQWAKCPIHSCMAAEHDTCGAVFTWSSTFIFQSLSPLPPTTFTGFLSRLFIPLVGCQTHSVVKHLKKASICSHEWRCKWIDYVSLCSLHPTPGGSLSVSEPTSKRDWQRGECLEGTNPKHL